ncbi:MAG: protein translocase subunit SecD, partial [Spirulinaceae cyanobacterium RM2_2_10]|nr:protein translocase subunit SecD [Spirulinaceae cyanobacterium RM2_2_10]
MINFPLNQGLDLKGGSRLTLEVRPTEEVSEITLNNINDVREVILNRIDSLGVAEPVVQTVGTTQLVVQLPGVSDPEQAERILGGTAQLDFRTQRPGTEREFGPLFREHELAQVEMNVLRDEESPDPEAIANLQVRIQELNEEIATL